MKKPRSKTPVSHRNQDWFEVEKLRARAEYHLKLAQCEDFTASGAPDLEMVPWVERANVLLGSAYTVQSCCGHGPPERKAEGFVKSGCLWLRFREERAFDFDGTARSLLAIEAVERVSRIWGAEEFPVLEIVFRVRREDGETLSGVMLKVLDVLLAEENQ